MLSSLFKTTVENLGINADLKDIINLYMKSKASANGGRTRSSLSSDSTADEITWKKYVDLMLNLLDVEKINFSIEIMHANKTISFHEVNMK